VLPRSGRYALLEAVGALGAVCVFAFAATWQLLGNADSLTIGVLWAATGVAGSISVIAGIRKVERTIEGSVRINVPVERLFAFLSDSRNDSHWIPRIDSVEQLTDGPIETGTRFRAVLSVAGRKRIIESEITVYDPPVALDERLIGRGDVTGGYRLRAFGDATELTVKSRFRVGVGPALVCMPLGRRQVRASLGRLKSYAEANLGHGTSSPSS
jgi:carbon monoxide dehydrogenase subunit G